MKSANSAFYAENINGTGILWVRTMEKGKSAYAALYIKMQNMLSSRWNNRKKIKTMKYFSHVAAL